ncbi:MAG: PAS domain S-box protein [Pleurocapsa sp.]
MKAEEHQGKGKKAFAGGGEIGAVLRAHDWPATPLGAVETWSDSLKTAVQILLNELERAKPPAKTQLESDLLAFRVKLTDALRQLSDAAEIQAIAAQILGNSLKASRVIYLEVLPGGKEVSIDKNYTKGVAELSGRYRLEDFGRNLIDDHQSGRIVIAGDVANSPQYTASEKDRYRAINIAAHIDVPLIKNNQFVALLAVHQATPRQWTEDEVKRVEQTAEQTWAAVERAHAESALSRSRVELEQQLRRFEAIASAIPDFIYTFDLSGRFTYINQPLLNLLEKTSAEVLGKNFFALDYPADIATRLQRQIQQVIETRQSLKDEATFPTVIGTRAYEYIFVPLFNAEGAVEAVAGVTRDISDRQRTELNREFLATVSQSLVEATCVDEIVQTVGAGLSRYLDIASCVFVEINEQADEAVVNYDWHQGDQASLIGVYSLPELITDEFMQAAQTGQPMVIRDYATDPRVSNPSRFAALGVGAEINIPFIEDGEWKFSLVVFQPQPYDWRDSEIELMQKLAARVWRTLERVRVDGYFEYILSPVFAADGTVESVAGSSRNISDRQQTEAALRESETRLRFMLDASQIGDWDLDLTTETHTAHRSLRHDQIFGYESLLPEWSYDIFLSHVHPDDRAAVNEQFQQTLSARTNWNFECRIIHPDQSLHWIWVRSSVYCDTNGTPNRLLGMVIDITDRVQIEAALHDSEDRFRMAIEAAQLGTWDWNLLTNQLIWDEGCKTMFGLPPEAESSIKVFFAALHPDDRERLEQLLQWTLNPASSGKYDVEYRTIGIQDGVERWIAAKGQVYFDAAGTPQRFVGTVLNITEQKRIEAEREQLLAREQAAREAADRANRVKDEFLAVLSHELRTPLNPILGWVRLLQNSKLDADQRAEALKTIEHNARLQAQLIEDLLDISSIMQGKLSLTEACVDLTLVISAAVETVRLAAQAKQIRITLDLDSAIAPMSGDAARLQQVVWNLLTNAIKFTPHGGQVTVELGQLDRLAQIRVIDTGKGINPQFLPHVFEYFRQEDGSTTRQFGGLGLGLAIVRQIVEMHGGKITAESQGENQGATFIIQLPIMQQRTSGISQPIDQQTEAAVPLNGVHILLVDDEPDNREFQAFLLEHNGAKVTAVASGSEALQALDRFTPDVLLSDIGMTSMDGYMLMEQIRSRPANQGGTIRAIALTAYAAEIDRQKALQVGFQTHITKPVEPEKLVRAITNLLERTR